MNGLGNSWDRIGQVYAQFGEDRIGALVDRFYQEMDTDPNAAGIRRLHADDLRTARDKLFRFLVGRFGGPPLYVQQYGPPRLRARHVPFPIGDAERDQWIACMRRALEACVPEQELRRDLLEFFSAVADSMKNR